MRSRKKLWLLLIPLLLTVLALCLLPGRSARKLRPSLIEEESFFSDYVVRNNRVYFLCHLNIRNPSDKPVAVRITGDFSEDVKSGLLKNTELRSCRIEEPLTEGFQSLSAEELEATAFWTYDTYQGADVFPIPPGGRSFWVLFVGEHGTADVKQNRLLPPLSFRPLRDVTPEEVLAKTGCRIFKDSESCRAYLLDGESFCELGSMGMGGYGFTSAVPWDCFGINEVPDLLFTYSWGSGMHRSVLTLFDRTSREEQDLYVYYPRDYDSSVFGSDLLVELVTDESGASSYTVYTADVMVKGDNYADLLFTKRAKAGVVGYVLTPDGSRSRTEFTPDGAFLGLSILPETIFPVQIMSPDAPEQEGFGCEVEIGGETAWLQDETAEELYRICLGAMELSETISQLSIPNLESRPPLRLSFRVIPPAGTSEETDFSTYLGTFWVYYDFENDYAYFSPNPYSSFMAFSRLPAGTYDALRDTLTRNGTKRTSP